jgi:hypothetical protein
LYRAHWHLLEDSNSIPFSSSTYRLYLHDGTDGSYILLADEAVMTDWQYVFTPAQMDLISSRKGDELHYVIAAVYEGEESDITNSSCWTLGCGFGSTWDPGSGHS